MTGAAPPDKSNGYEAVARTFMATRNARIGAATIGEWSRTLPRGGSVLDLGCGHGIPISKSLTGAGLSVSGVDGSPTLIAAYRRNFPGAQAECAAVEDSTFFHRTFDGIVAWGLLFLLPLDAQAHVIRKVARAVEHGGHFVFTSPEDCVVWRDALTGRTSVSAGRETYAEMLATSGLVLQNEETDEGRNHY